MLLQLKLEEAFLNSQPMSTRKSIDFVSERVASTCIKYVCNKIVPDYKKEALKEFKKKLKENKSDAVSCEKNAIYLRFLIHFVVYFYF